MSAIYILWLREVKKYLRSRSRIFGSLGQPVLYLLAFGYGLGAIYARGAGGNYIQFLAPGIILMTVLFSGIFSGISLIWDRQFGFLKETMVAPVPRLSIMLGKTLGGATVAVIQGLIVFAITLFFGFRPHDLTQLPLALVFISLAAIFFTALGTAVASRLQDMQGFQLIMNFLVMPIFFLSGALFPLSGLPFFMEILTKVDPLSYAVDGARSTLINISTFGVGTDLLVLGVATVLILLIGSYLFEKIQV